MVYPYTKYRFKVEIKEIGEIGFSEVSGLDASVSVHEYREGSDAAPTASKVPGIRKYSNITFKWGLTNSMDVYEWIHPSLDKDITRSGITVTLLNEDAEEVAIWEMINAWPVKYTAPDFNALNSDIAIEQLEVAHEGLTRTK
jgi:phage tail-like protein